MRVANHITNPWLPHHDALLRELAGQGVSTRVVAERLGRTKFATASRARKIGVVFAHPDAWPQEHVDTLIRLWGTHSGAAIGALIGQSRQSVIGKAWRLGLPRKGRVIVTARKSVSARSSLKRARVSSQPVERLSGKSSTSNSRSGGSPHPRPKPLAARGSGEAAVPLSIAHPPLRDGAGCVLLPAQLAPPISTPVPLMELTAKSCRYIVEGEGEHAKFCNADRDDSPYCEYHHYRCLYMPEKRARAA